MNYFSAEVWSMRERKRVKERVKAREKEREKREEKEKEEARKRRKRGRELVRNRELQNGMLAGVKGSFNCSCAES